MKKATFNPKGVTATLINRVYRTGMTMMSTINKAQKKSASFNPKVVDDLETDFLLANIELVNMLMSQLAQKKDESWKLFVDSVSKLGNAQKPIFRGVVRNIKQIAENILSNKPNPFDNHFFNLPPYITPYLPTAPVGVGPDFWKTVINDAKKLEASSKDVARDLTEAAEHAGMAVLAAVEGAEVSAVIESYNAGHEVGESINEYMGWNKE